ncbi:MAG: hypothetical protein JWM58_3607 [Rhizobium sp.]|nr:hypothetical protein [Rhizobium sp.]
MSFGHKTTFGRRGLSTEKAAAHGALAPGDPSQKVVPSDPGIRTPIEVVKRFADAIATIHSDAVGMASTVRTGGRIEGGLPPDAMYWPIRWKDSEKLFEHVKDGQTLFVTYLFTTDLVTAEAAQTQIGMLYNRVLDANMLSHGFLMFGLNEEMLMNLKRRLDEILVKSAFLTEALKTYPLVIDRLTKRIDQKADKQFTEQLFAQQMQALVKVRALMFEPEKLPNYVPYSGPCLVAAAHAPYEEGQMIIDGVYFSRALAAPIMEFINKKRAAAMASESSRLATESVASITRH